MLEFLETAVWHCEPPSWSLSEETGLSLETGHKTDFWQDTYYGFNRDDGHFFGESARAELLAAQLALSARTAVSSSDGVP